MNADRFIRSLQQLEREHSPEPLLPLFSEQSSLQRLNSADVYRGVDGADVFWREYLSLFKDIRSRFTSVIEADTTSVLEWDANGHFENGEPVHYKGVSIVEFSGDKVRAFRTYYDSAAFTQHAHA